MATHVIDADNSYSLAAGKIRIEVVTTPQTGAYTATVSPAGSVGSVRSKIVVPSIDEPTRLEVVPADGTFPAGSMFSVTVSHDDDALGGSEAAVLSNADLSGRGAQVLIDLRPDAGSIVVSTGFGKIDQFDGVALAANVSARRILDADTVNATSALNVTIAVDSSASMLEPARDGTVAAVVGVLSGVGRVLSPGRVVRAALVGSHVTWIDAPAPDLSAAVATAQAAASLAVGFRSAHPELAGLRPDENTMTYLITDDLPADLPALAAQELIEGEARHVVVIGTGTDTKVDGIPVTYIPPVDSAEKLAGRLEFDPDALDRIVRSLLRGCFARGTTYAGKIPA